MKETEQLVSMLKHINVNTIFPTNIRSKEIIAYTLRTRKHLTDLNLTLSKVHTCI